MRSISGRICATPATSILLRIVVQRVFGRQLFAADGFFLRQEIIVDGKPVLLELGEEFFHLFDFVQLLILLQPLAANLIPGCFLRGVPVPVG